MVEINIESILGSLSRNILPEFFRANSERIEEILNACKKTFWWSDILQAVRYLVKAREYGLAVKIMAASNRASFKGGRDDTGVRSSDLEYFAEEKEYGFLVDIAEIVVDNSLISEIVNLLLKARREELAIDIVKFFAKGKNVKLVVAILEGSPDIFSRCMQIEYVSQIFKIKPSKKK